MKSCLPRSPLTSPREDIPELHNGDRLKQPEFHRRYMAMPEGIKCELIGGVVYMSAPSRRRGHGGPHLRLATVLGVYEAATPGVRAADNATLVLGVGSEPEPDLCVRSITGSGRRAQRDIEDAKGVPDLVLEVASSSDAIELHEKREDYRRAGVPEYLVLCVRDGELRAFDLKANRERRVDADGVYRSKGFPGLWIDVAAALSADTAKLLSVVQQGIATPGHAAFVKKLKARAERAKRSKLRDRKPWHRG